MAYIKKQGQGSMGKIWEMTARAVWLFEGRSRADSWTGDLIHHIKDLASNESESGMLSLRKEKYL